VDRPKSFLDVLPEEVHQRFRTTMGRRRFGRGEVLFHEGDPAGTVHVIESGHVLLRLSTPRGDQVTLTVVGPREAVGVSGLLTEARSRIVTAVAVGPVRTRTITADEFDRLRREVPAVDHHLVDMLAQQQLHLMGFLLDSLFATAEVRLLRCLDMLCDMVGQADPGGGVRLAISQEDLALMAGTTRPTANRMLTSTQEEGLVSLGRGRVTVLDREALARRAARR
jgi:CRP-like cAMP-binding protein